MKNQSRCRITKTVVASAAPGRREYVIWDTGIQGFGLRVRPSGSRSFVFVYRSGGGRAGKVRRVTIAGNNPEVAREKAKVLAAQHHGGGDPAEAKAAARRSTVTTVAALLDQFINDHVDKELKAKTAAEYRRIVEKLLKPRLGTIAVDALETKDVAAAYQAMRHTPTQAAAAIRVLSSAMSLAEEWGLRPAGSNPRIRLRGARRRERLFSDVEVARLMRSIDKLQADEEISVAVALGLRLLFASGCRAGEIASLQWNDVDLDLGVMRWRDSKTGYLEKPITSETRTLLESATRVVGVPYVCQSANHGQMRIETLEAGFERAMAAAKVPANENASLHLIRHWFASKTYSNKSIPLPLQMRIVGHKSVATAMRYAHVTTAEVQEAAEGAARRRARAIKAADGRVVPLRGA